MSVKSFLIDAVKSAANVHRAGPQPDILLFATPRSGSTWLMEIIASQPRFKFYDEPLNLRRENVAASGVVPDWPSLMPDTCDAGRILGFLRGLQHGKHGYMNPPPFRPRHRFFTDRIVFKIHEIEHLMEAAERELSAQVVYLLRHPVATSISRKVLPRLDLFTRCRLHAELLHDRARRAEISLIAVEGSFLQRAIASWCFENLIALRRRPESWLYVTYEELLLNPWRSADLLMQKLKLRDRESLLMAFDRPATNVRMSDDRTLSAFGQRNADYRRFRLATKWRDGITEVQLKQAKHVLELFDIDAYKADEDLAAAGLLHFGDTSVRLERGAAEFAGMTAGVARAVSGR